MILCGFFTIENISVESVWLSSYVQDRYILATMICLASVCFWHGAQIVIPRELMKKHSIDIIALVIVAGLTVLYNIQFILRIYAVVSSGKFWSSRCFCVYLYLAAIYMSLQILEIISLSVSCIPGRLLNREVYLQRNSSIAFLSFLHFSVTTIN